MKTSFDWVIKWIWSASFFFLSLCSFSQAIATSSGDWDDTGIWTGANVGDNLETVTFNNSIGAVTIRDGFNYTVGSIDLGNANTLNVNGILNIGDISNGADLTADNGCTITIGSSGEIIIWGNLIAFNNLSFGLGKLTIKGNLDVRNGANLDIVGTVQIDGDFLTGTNTIVNMGASGNLNVDGQYAVGNGSVMTGTGTATGSPCTGSPDFCNFSTLPVELIEFYGTRSSNTIELVWSTATEINNDYFDIQKSEDGVNFLTVGRVNGNGTTTNQNAYTFSDRVILEKPIYYRLNQVDFDGTNEFSKIIVVSNNFQLSGNSNVELYPNPMVSSDELFIRSSSGLKRVIILDSQGKHLMNLLPGQLDDKSLRIPAFLKSGIYLIQYELANGSIGQSKFIRK
jgi:hypothetical protein